MGAGCIAGALAIPPVVYARLKGAGLSLWFPHKRLGLELVFGTTLGCLMASMNGMACILAAKFAAERPLSGLELLAWRMRQPAEIAAVLVAAGLAAPLAEEIFFRGVLYPTLRRTLPVAASVILSCVAFGAAHSEAMHIRAGLLGALTAILLEYTGSLIPGTLAHAGANIGFVAFTVDGGRLSNLVPLWSMVAIFALLNVVLVCLGRTMFKG